MSAIGAGYGAFVETLADANPDPNKNRNVDAWGRWENRRLRYAINWACYQNNLYRDIHSFASKYKADYGLDRNTRGIYNPAARLAGFWSAHLWGGPLDMEAGDGSMVATALPIQLPKKKGDGEAEPGEPDTDPLRLAIGRLWSDSQWQVKKDTVTLWGPIFGDPGIKVVDDPEAGTVTLEPVHPGTLRWLERDNQGNTLSYVIEEMRTDPTKPSPVRNPNNPDPTNLVKYTETAELDGDTVVYRTFKDGYAYGWGGGPSEWTLPYGFIPLFMANHIPGPGGWGMGEFDTGRPKFDGVNDLASKTHDQVRIIVSGAWMISGAKPPGNGAARPEATATPGPFEDPTQRKSAPSRDEMKVFYAPAEAKATPLIFPLDLGAITAEIEQAMEDIESDYPELLFDKLRTKGEFPSGEAIRMARQSSSTRVNQRRPSYDHMLCKAQMGAIAIGGWRSRQDGGERYEEYAGYDLGSYFDGSLRHSIKDRPVFAVEPLDLIAEDKAEAEAVKAWVDAGVSKKTALKRAGWSEEDIEEELANEQENADAESQRQRDLMQAEGDITKDVMAAKGGSAE